MVLHSAYNPNLVFEGIHAYIPTFINTYIYIHRSIAKVTCGNNYRVATFGTTLTSCSSPTVWIYVQNTSMHIFVLYIHT